MDFRKKTISLLSILGALIVVYILTFVLSQESTYKRGSQWTPFTEKPDSYASGKVVKINNSIQLIKDGEKWFVRDDENGPRLPAKTTRIENMLKALTARGNYPVRSKNPASFKNFGLDGESAKSIFIQDGGTVIAGFYLGNSDAGGKEIFLRRVDGELNDTSGVRSGPDVFSTYLSGSRVSWTDTRLFKNHDRNGLTVDSIQTVEVHLSAAFADDSPVKAKEDYVLTRDKDDWKFSDAPETKVDPLKVESLIRSALDAAAEDYAPSGFEESAVTAKLVLRQGDGSTHIISLGDRPDEKYRAAVSDDRENGNDYTYLLSDWTVSRLFPDKAGL